MAVVRTVLPRKGIIQPGHGDNYETDLDTNWQIIDSGLQDAADVQAAVTAAGTVQVWVQDRGLCGVMSGFDLSPSFDLTPIVSVGVLYAQGQRYAPSAPPDPGPAPANSTSYLFYSSATGFYYSLSGSPALAGDAYLGSVTSDATHVTAVTDATKVYGMLAVTAPAPGNFSLPHNLGRTPLGALIYLTSGGALWFQSPTLFDGANLYLVASDSDITGKVQLW
jgi:hypothetical protein